MWDISDPHDPRLRSTFVCPGGQGDPTLYRNLLFFSVEETNGRIDCGAEGVQTRSAPSASAACASSTSPTSSIRSKSLPCRPAAARTPTRWSLIRRTRRTSTSTCSGTAPGALAATSSRAARRSARPGRSEHVALPDRRHPGAARRPRAGGDRELTRESSPTPPGPSPVSGQGRPPVRGHAESRIGPISATTSPPTRGSDWRAAPAVGTALLLDIRDPVHPVRIDAVDRPEHRYWHSATFNNDGTKMLFSDEWGGGAQPRCRATDTHGMGRRRDLHDRATGKMTFASYYKMPAPQTTIENCVAHNGSLIPIPGRDIMVQAFVSGRPLGVRLHRCCAPEGNRILRPWADGFDQTGRRRLLVGLLVQRLHRTGPRSPAASTSSSSSRADCSRRTRSTRRSWFT